MFVFYVFRFKDLQCRRNYENPDPVGRPRKRRSQNQDPERKKKKKSTYLCILYLRFSIPHSMNHLFILALKYTQWQNSTLKKSKSKTKSKTKKRGMFGIHQYDVAK